MNRFILSVYFRAIVDHLVSGDEVMVDCGDSRCPTRRIIKRIVRIDASMSHSNISFIARLADWSFVSSNELWWSLHCLFVVHVVNLSLCS